MSFRKFIQSVFICFLIVYGNIPCVNAQTDTEKKQLATEEKADAKKTIPQQFLSLQQLLKGNHAGLYVQENNGEPGAIQSMLIRGLSSPVFSNKDVSGNLPAVYLNGIPLMQDHPFLYDLKQHDIHPIGTAANTFAGLDIASIESIEVVKDPLLLAKLGPLAANGAICITTKDGYYGGKNFSVGLSTGMAFAPGKIRMTNAAHEKAFRQNFYDVYNVPSENRTYPDYLSDTRDANYFGNPDWADSYYQSTPLYNVNVAGGGGTAAANYVFTLAHTKNAGVADKTFYTKYNIGFGLNMVPFDGLLVSTLINAAKIDRGRNLNLRDRYAEMEYMVDFSMPVAPANNAYGTFLEDNRDLVKDDNFNNSLTGHLSLKYSKDKIYAGAKFQMDYATNIRRAFWPTTMMESVNFVSNYSGYNRRVIGNAYAGYLWDIAKKHHLDFRWDGSILTDVYQYNYTRAYDGDDDKKPTTNTGNFKLYRYVNNLENRLVSTSFSLDYKYGNLYQLGVLLRYDGNSNVQTDNRWLFTPSFSAGWNLKNQFFTASGLFSKLMLNASWARMGKFLQSDKYAFGPQYVSSDISWNGQPVLSSSNGYPTITRPYLSGWIGYDLGWAYTDKLDVELNASFLNNRLGIGLGLYENKDKDLITQIPVTQELGYKFRHANGMEISNKGIELKASAIILSGATPDKLKWNLSFNAAYNRNELQKLPENRSEIIIGDHKLKVGEAIGAFWVYQNQGVYTNDNEVPVKEGKPLSIGGVPFQKGDPRWADIDGNNIINNDDRILKGHALPPFTGGLTNQFAYDRFDFSFHLFFATGHSALNLRDQQRYDFLTLDNLQSLQSIKEIFFWQSTRQKDDYPIYSPSSSIHPYRAEQDLFLEKLSYLKLRSVTLGYTLPLKAKSAQSLESIYFYLTADNWFTISSFSGDDPELVNFNGTYDGYSSPIPRSVSLGLRFKF